MLQVRPIHRPRIELVTALKRHLSDLAKARSLGSSHTQFRCTALHPQGDRADLQPPHSALRHSCLCLHRQLLLVLFFPLHQILSLPNSHAMRMWYPSGRDVSKLARVAHVDMPPKIRAMLDRVFISDDIFAPRSIRDLFGQRGREKACYRCGILEGLIRIAGGFLPRGRADSYGSQLAVRGFKPTVRIDRRHSLH